MEHSNLMCDNGCNFDFTDKSNITGRRGLFDPFPKNRFENKSYLEPELGVLDEHYYFEITFVFSIIFIAANIQHLINYYKFNLPYEAFVLLLSVVGGILSKLYPTFDSFTLIANINPILTMNMFLPSIIIYTVFSIDFYIITKCFGQVLILGIFGFILQCIITGSIMVLFLDQTLPQTWENIFIFGITCSLTQPKEVLRVLKRVGEFKHITALLEAESLLSLSLCFFLRFNIRFGNEQSKDQNTFAIAVVFYYFGSIFFGVAIGWMTFYVLKWINTGGRAFSYTLVCISYLIYVYSPEACFSRGTSLMSFLWVLHKMKSALSPSDELFFQHIIKALGFISNTIIIAFTVIVITEKILKDIILFETIEIVGAFVTYFVTYMVRFGVLFSLLPILRKVGYYIPWKHMLIIVICGIRSSFVLCFALTTMVDYDVKSNTKFLICLSVLVLFSITVNPLFLSWLIKKLHLDHVDDAKAKNMTAILKDITNRMRSEISALKANKEYLETNWNVVENFTIIKHPYPWAESADVIENWQQRNISSTCPLCVKEEYRKGTYIGISMEANRRILQIKKINFRRQYNEGLLQSPELQLLEAAIDHASDTKTKVLNFESVKDLWTQSWFLDKCRRRLIRIVFFSKEQYIRPPLNRIRYKMYKIITFKYYEAIIFVWNCLSLVPFVYEKYYLATDEKTLKLEIVLDVIYVTFFFIFLFDFLIKLYAMGGQYFTFWWKLIEFALLLCSTLGFGIDMYNLLTVHFQQPYNLNEVNYWLKISRAVYLLRIIQLIQLNIPRILMYMDSRVLEDRLSGYNIAQCVIKTQEEIVKYAQYMSENEGPSFEVEQRESSYRFEVQKDLDSIPRGYNLIGITVKTKHASQMILNDMKLYVEGLKEKGIIDDMESKLFKEIFNDKYNELKKKVLIPSPLPSSAIKGIPWIADDKVVYNYLTECAELLWYQTGQEILSVNNHSKGLYVILSGQATSSYFYSQRANYNQKLYGMLPNCDFFMHLNFDDSQKHDDVLYPGTVFGEIGVLTDRPYNYTVICTSSVMVSFFSKLNIQKAFNLYTNLELDMWKTVAIKVASLKSYLPFKELHVHTLKYKLQNGYMFILHNCVSLELNNFPGYIFLLEGTMEDKTNNTKYIAPTYFDEISQNLSFFDNSVNKDLKKLSRDFDKQKVDVKILVIGKYDRNIKVVSERHGKYILIEDQMSSLCERHKKDPSTELEGFSEASFTLDESHEDLRSIQSRAIAKLLKPFRTLNKRTNTSNEDT